MTARDTALVETGFEQGDFSPELVELQKLARANVLGSTNVPIQRRLDRRRNILQHRHTITSIEDIDQEVAEIFPVDPSTMWQIEPGFIRLAEGSRKNGEKSEVSYAEFIGGIAVANNIEPTDSQIASTIFFLGAEIHSLYQGDYYA